MRLPHPADRTGLETLSQEIEGVEVAGKFVKRLTRPAAQWLAGLAIDVSFRHAACGGQGCPVFAQDRELCESKIANGRSPQVVKVNDPLAVGRHCWRAQAALELLPSWGEGSKQVSSASIAGLSRAHIERRFRRLTTRRAQATRALPRSDSGLLTPFLCTRAWSP